MRTLLIDGDPLAWRATYLVRDGIDAALRACRAVDDLMVRLHATRAIVCVSDSTRRYFRHELFAGYKPNREELPAFYAEAVDGLGEGAGKPAKWLPGLEADDVIGILATGGTLRGDVVIVADDKDLLTIPGRHHHPKTHVSRNVDEDQAGYQHLLQTLIGDTGDGYKGCPDVGPQKAATIVSLETYARYPALAWQAVVKAFRAKGKSEADALLQARLARICRACDFDLDRRQVIPWMLPTRGTAADLPTAAGVQS